jgi:hypothetical protein
MTSDNIAFINFVQSSQAFKLPAMLWTNTCQSVLNFYLNVREVTTNLTEMSEQKIKLLVRPLTQLLIIKSENLLTRFLSFKTRLFDFLSLWKHCTFLSYFENQESFLTQNRLLKQANSQLAVWQLLESADFYEIWKNSNCLNFKASK